MKMFINYIENELILDKQNVLSIEVENKDVFNKLVKDYNLISNGELCDQIRLYDNNSVEDLKVASFFNVFTDYYNLDINNKKIINLIASIVEDEFNDKEINIVSKLYKNVESILKSKFNDFNFKLDVSNGFELKSVLKLFKVEVLLSDVLIDNLYTLIDVLKICSPDSVIVFINLKLYLSVSELNELYKYAIYNELYMIMIDFGTYGICKDYEKKLVIDEDLFEYMIQ